MNIITQMSLFEESEFEFLGDLERLQEVLGALDDEKLIRTLYKIRGKGRNDWSCEAMWNSFVASFLFEHPSIQALLRELNRNKQLRKLCGFEPKTVKKSDGSIKIYVAPSASAYTNFLRNLMECQDLLDEMFEDMVRYMYEHLENFGETLAIDGKAIDSFGTTISKNKKSGRRGEHDADWCQKQYTCNGANGEIITKTKKWFGFRLHLIADATYELPVSFEVTKASTGEPTVAKDMVTKMRISHKDRMEKCKYFLGDKGYDGSKLIEMLKEHDIRPIIDIRNCWKDGEETRQYRETNLVYNYKGDVWYVEGDGTQTPLLYKGYDKNTDSLRYGFHPQKHDNRIFRIKCEEDVRIFTPVARGSKKWKRIYKKRTSVERINGRIDRDYKYEKHTVRGLAKMSMFISVTFLVYMGMAKAKIEMGHTEHLCKLYA